MASIKAFFAIQNLFDSTQFVEHTISADSEAVGREAWRVGTNRRLGRRNRWEPATFNTDAWLRVDCSKTRMVDFMAIDRDHNLPAGHECYIQASFDDFASKTDYMVQVPQVGGNNLDSAHRGVVTREGAWIIRFPAIAGASFRFYIPALGTDLRPQISGLYMGKGYEPEYLLDLPYDNDGGETRFQETESDTAWVASNRFSHRRAGAIRLKMSRRAEYEMARQTLVDLFLAERRVGWIVHSQQDAGRAVLALHGGGRYSSPVKAGWGQRQIEFDWVEHEPKVE